MFFNFTQLTLILFFFVFGLKWYIAGLFGREVGQILFLLPLCFYLYIYYIRSSLIKVNSPFFFVDKSNNLLHNYLLFSYVILICISIIRATGLTPDLTLTNTIGRLISVVIIFSYSLLITDVYKYHYTTVWDTITIALIIYMAMNVLGLIFGLTSQFIMGLNLDVVTNDAFGIWNNRLLFPFTSTPGVFSVEIGLLTILLYPKLIQYKTKLFLAIIVSLFLLSIFCMVGGNSRTAMLCVVLAILSRYLSQKYDRKLFVITLFFIMIFPIVISYVNFDKYYSIFPNSLASILRSNDPSEIFTVNNRNYIWKHAFDNLIYVKPIHIIGYGAFGRISSSIAFNYAAPWQNPLLLSLHNGYIETVIDIGYIGIFVLLFLLLLTYFRITDKKINHLHRDILTPKSLFIYMVLCNFFGLFVYHNNNLLFFIFILVILDIIACSKYKSNDYTK